MIPKTNLEYLRNVYTYDISKNIYYFMLQMHYDTRKLFIYSNNKNRLKENYSSTMLKLFINSGHYYEFIDT